MYNDIINSSEYLNTKNQEEKMYFLNLACGLGDLSIVEHIIESDFNKFITKNDMERLIVHACNNNSKNVCNYLINKFDVAQLNINYILNSIKFFNDKPMTKYLIKKGADYKLLSFDNDDDQKILSVAIGCDIYFMNNFNQMINEIIKELYNEAYHQLAFGMAKLYFTDSIEINNRIKKILDNENNFITNINIRSNYSDLTIIF